MFAMRVLAVILLGVICFSFCPTTENETAVANSGFLITIEDHTTRTFEKYLVQDKDSVYAIFNSYFGSELKLGRIDRPISIYNGKHDFYVAKVNLFTKPNGKLGFKNLKYPPVYIKKKDRREKMDPVYM